MSRDLHRGQKLLMSYHRTHTSPRYVSLSARCSRVGYIVYGFPESRCERLRVSRTVKFRRSRHDLTSRATVSSKTLEVGPFGWSGVFTCGVLGYPAPRNTVARVTIAQSNCLPRVVAYSGLSVHLSSFHCTIIVIRPTA
jgi:hypothetical protein